MAFTVNGVEFPVTLTIVPRELTILAPTLEGLVSEVVGIWGDDPVADRLQLPATTGMILEWASRLSGYAASEMVIRVPMDDPWLIERGRK